jgi:hypothetical protein
VGSPLESLPVNSTGQTRVLWRVDGVVSNGDASADLSLLPLERATPIRRFFAWTGKRNYEGSWWSSTVRAHVPFESLLERQYLMSGYDSLIWPQGGGLKWPHRLG